MTDLEEGAYEFRLVEVGLMTCEGHTPAPPSWEGQLDVRGRDVLLSLEQPAFFGAVVGGQSMVGRFFEEEEEEQNFILDTAFDILVQLGDVACPAFYQLSLDARVDGPESFSGFFTLSYSMRREAPLPCPRACAIRLAFDALRLGPLEDGGI